MMKNNPISICAVIAAKNEFYYLKILLPILQSQNIDVVIIDNGSTDESWDLYKKHEGSPIISVENLKPSKTFSLSKQLEKKNDIYLKLDHDWLVHHDADEILEHYKPGLTLRDAVQEADSSNYNVLNFEEFTFLPEKGTDYKNRNYHKELLQYYFMARHKNFYNRAWKNASNLSNTEFGGHIVKGENVNLFPENHILRHYIVLNEEHAIKKYTDRIFDTEEIKKGWHKDRLSISRRALELPTSSKYLFRLKQFDTKDFIRSTPALEPYWKWLEEP